MADWPELTLEEIALFGAYPGEADPAPGSLVFDIRTAHSGGVLALRDYHATVAQLDANPDPLRSDAGLAMDKRAKGEGFIEKLQNHRARLAGFVKRRDALLEPVRLIPKASEDRLLDFMRGAELRGHLASLDPLPRGVVLRECAERGDVDTLAAVRAAPSYAPLADADLIAELEMATLEVAAPSRAAELRAATEALNATAQAIDYAEAEIMEAAGITDDPIAVMAADGDTPLTAAVAAQ